MQSEPSAAHGRWHRPRSLDEALHSLRERRWTVLAGGTDLYAGTERAALAGPVLDISALHALRGVAQEQSGGGRALRIGALATWADLVAARLPQQFDAISLAAREVGGAQIQNRGTVGGNLCNASPAADGTVALLALDAELELAREGGNRTVPLAQFVRGVRRTALEPDELLAAVRVPVRGGDARSTFLKLGHRRFLVISIAMVAVSATLDKDERIAHAAIAVGACAPTAVRLATLEQRLLGMRAGELPRALARLLDDDAFAPISPIDDVRGSGRYRRDAVATLVARALSRVCAG